MQISVDLPPTMVERIDQLVVDLKQFQTTKPVWPFSTNSINVSQLTMTQRSQLANFRKRQKEWEAGAKYKLPCNRSVVVEAFLKEAIKKELL